jgi:hypothetical protein
MFVRLLTSVLLNQQNTRIPFEFLKALPLLGDGQVTLMRMFRILFDFQVSERRLFLWDVQTYTFP